MFSLRECQSLIDHKFRELELPQSPANLYEPIRYMLDLEAKRIRPSLVLMGCNVFSDDIGQAIYPALAVEVFHNFTLMHDDIMDQSAMRRKHPSVYAKWNLNVAILAGDAMLIKAYELLSSASQANPQKILQVFNQTALEVCEGQQYDMDYEQSTVISIADYIRMVELKTAVLLAASLKIGALLGGAGEKESDCLYEFGKNIGIAFQLQDDLLDVFADPAQFGKVTGNDIVSNKKTILLIEALSRAEGGAREKLLKWISRKDYDRDEKIRAVKSVYTELRLAESVTDKIRHYHEMAVGHLNNLCAEPDRKSELLAFSNYLMNRKK